MTLRTDGLTLTPVIPGWSIRYISMSAARWRSRATLGAWKRVRPGTEWMMATSTGLGGGGAGLTWTGPFTDGRTTPRPLAPLRSACITRAICSAPRSAGDARGLFAEFPLGARRWIRRLPACPLARTLPMPGMARRRSIRSAVWRGSSSSPPSLSVSRPRASRTISIVEDSKTILCPASLGPRNCYVREPADVYHSRDRAAQYSVSPRPYGPLSGGHRVVDFSAPVCVISHSDGSVSYAKRGARHGQANELVGDDARGDSGGSRRRPAAPHPGCRRGQGDPEVPGIDVRAAVAGAGKAEVGAGARGHQGPSRRSAA